MSIDIQKLLGGEAKDLLSYKAKVGMDLLELPGPDFMDRVFSISNRSRAVIKNMEKFRNTGRLAGSGYVSILPVDQGVEHTAGASFAPNPIYFDPDNICKLAVEAGCNAVATTVGVLSMVSKKYAGKVPFLAKINHNEILTYPQTYDQILFASVQQAYDLGAVAIGATIYFGSQESDRQIQEIAQAFELAHQKGMFTVAWCYLRNSEFKKGGKDYHTSADMTGQANHLAASIGADIVKQKFPEVNGGFEALKFGKTHAKMYTDLSSDNPIDLVRYQVLNGYAGRVGLINSGGESKGAGDLEEVVRTAVINKRAGGTGMITGRKAFKKSMDEGIELLHAVQDVYLSNEVTIA
ncbi:MAG: fructose-bisphosphate aldolase [Candidatus Buchananbacteria bacterium CG10_big_fil_rev_8_21_14_0_10_42_9]|uniref:fructose-bisphosphate aldolase n=1 Tax=Candidatus Buchananbacteria bacterium CG10_big_fil_rev_8_21_14_0_10_42_9 TaxID=1974526 RepID=A0A2H0W0R2_9BACT|nr:MAG: fructose-bisphosphate aldolase [Candidatus Buchananbacteria bacterium CG10_big_fil_rev_8_21_14_0_10_42_9]